MRIKIKGEITAERLAEALQKASEKYEAVRPGHKIYGANLYLTAYDADGLPFDLADHRGEPLSITIEAKSGELVKPALTAEGERKRMEAKLAAEVEESETKELLKQQEQKWREEAARKQQERQKARQQFEWLNGVTASLLKSQPERFLEELNKAVQAAWNECKPLAKMGATKGQPLPMPSFSTHGGGLLLSVETWKNPRRVLNPICTLAHGEIEAFWKHEAWTQATNYIMDVLDRMLDESRPKAAGSP
ncbi:OfxX fusion product [Escherichia coli]|uniref:OfxX fusion product n=1 Tax=Escherichia coli TaxID=562 RepID=UPI0010CAEFF7|nr:OfxX fusion product [Escherichia coli]GCY10647.1 hypothetical protein HmCmsJML102_00360 [Escherichia coli]